MVDGWCKAALEKASMGAMMQLIKAYRWAGGGASLTLMFMLRVMN
jgi:hypothetical protein